MVCVFIGRKSKTFKKNLLNILFKIHSPRVRNAILVAGHAKFYFPFLLSALFVYFVFQLHRCFAEQSMAQNGFCFKDIYLLAGIN